MNEEIVRGLFVCAGIPIKDLWELPNQYWPNTSHYEDIRRKSPWWLIYCEFGHIKIGWRKRVIQISWETPLDPILQSDLNVTQTPTLIHAWSVLDALKYLGLLKTRLYKEQLKASQLVPNISSGLDSLHLLIEGVETEKGPSFLLFLEKLESTTSDALQFNRMLVAEVEEEAMALKRGRELQKFLGCKFEGKIPL